jgi:hypothetical protein
MSRNPIPVDYTQIQAPSETTRQLTLYAVSQQAKAAKIVFMFSDSGVGEVDASHRIPATHITEDSITVNSVTWRSARDNYWYTHAPSFACVGYENPNAPEEFIWQLPYPVNPSQEVVEKVDFITITQPVDLDAIEARVNALDEAVVLAGTWDPTSGSFPNSSITLGSPVKAGWSYLVTADETVSGVEFKNGDRIIAIVDNPSTSVYAANWYHADYTDKVSSVAGQVGNVTAAQLKTAIDAEADTNFMTDAERTKLTSVESNATADQTDEEIETAYNNRVGVVSQVEAEAGTVQNVRRWTPERVKQAISALGGLRETGSNLDVNTYGTTTSAIVQVDRGASPTSKTFVIIGYYTITAQADGTRVARVRLRRSTGSIVSVTGGSAIIDCQHIGEGTAQSAQKQIIGVVTTSNRYIAITIQKESGNFDVSNIGLVIYQL